MPNFLEGRYPLVIAALLGLAAIVIATLAIHSHEKQRASWACVDGDVCCKTVVIDGTRCIYCGGGNLNHSLSCDFQPKTKAD